MWSVIEVDLFYLFIKHFIYNLCNAISRIGKFYTWLLTGGSVYGQALGSATRPGYVLGFTYCFIFFILLGF